MLKLWRRLTSRKRAARGRQTADDLLRQSNERMIRDLDRHVDVEAGLEELFRRLGPPPKGPTQ